ncbi:F-box protein At5g51370-like isoform X2 [Primulina tabacum]|uniref:F-box protein At5g51370-like isoform X2 n=1 Tax=Primulina tabacum TaxID=48773 RepID=UPI003F595D58
MSISPDKNRISDPNPVLDLGKLKKNSRSSWSDHLSNERVDPNEAFRHLYLKMRLQSLPNSGSTTPHSDSEPDSDSSNPNPPAPPDCISLLSDELLLKVLSKLTDRNQHLSNSLVCTRWCVVSGKLIQSIKLLDWEFLESGRLTFRFPNLVDVRLAHACIISERNSGILFINKLLPIHLSSGLLENDGVLISNGDVLDSEEVDRGVRIMVQGCRNLRRVVLMNVSEKGLSFLGEECDCLQEMELHYSGDLALPGIFKCRNLQILKLIGSISGVYDSVVTDIGLTILAQGCRRLVKLELVGCEGSYDGIKAMGQCCQMLEELTLCNHKMDGGWLSALSYCENLKTLKILSCNEIDRNPGSDEHLWPCPMLEELHLRQCQMREKQGVRALFLVCQPIRKLVIEDCWGLNNNVFAAASIFRDRNGAKRWNIFEEEVTARCTDIFWQTLEANQYNRKQRRILGGACMQLTPQDSMGFDSSLASLDYGMTGLTFSVYFLVILLFIFSRV